MLFGVCALTRLTYDIFTASPYSISCLTCTYRKRVFDALILHQWPVAKGLTSGNLFVARRQLKCNLRVRSLGDVVDAPRRRGALSLFLSPSRPRATQRKHRVSLRWDVTQDGENDPRVSSFWKRKYRVTSRTGQRAARDWRMMAIRDFEIRRRCRSARRMRLRSPLRRSARARHFFSFLLFGPRDRSRPKEKMTKREKDPPVGRE